LASSAEASALLAAVVSASRADPLCPGVL
jgi:hypothetical protein